MIKNQNGFGMIEMVIAFGIFMIAMLACFSMSMTAMRCNATGNMTTQAEMLAKEKLEQCTMHAWDLEDGTHVDQVSIYKRRWDIIPHTTLSKRVIVWVSWAPMIGSPKTVKFETLVGLSRDQSYK
jgi:Tfp pilus assembly protein PilV